jgi:hypothetical protein
MLALATAATAQPDLEPGIEAGLAPPVPIALLPIREGSVRKNRGLNIPINLRPGPERSFGVGYTATNSYLNPGRLVCFYGSCELEYQSDYTGNLLFFDGTWPVLPRFELGFGLGMFEMDEIPRYLPLHRIATDDSLRSFHENLLGEESLPTLSGAPDGRQVFAMTDLDGRRLRLRPEHDYALPLRVDLNRYFEFRESERARMGLNFGLHLSIPLEGDVDLAAGEAALARGMDFGVSVNFVRSRWVTPNVSSTFHLQIARFMSDVHVVNPDSPLNADDRMRSQYALTYGLRFANTFNGRAPCTFAMSQLTNSAHYDKDSFWAFDPVVFEGGNNLRGALAGANDYGMLSFGCDHRNRTMQLALAEDFGGFSQFFADDGAGTSYDPDFAISFSMTFRPGAGRD